MLFESLYLPFVLSFFNTYPFLERAVRNLTFLVLALCVGNYLRHCHPAKLRIVNHIDLAVVFIFPFIVYFFCKIILIFPCSLLLGGTHFFQKKKTNWFSPMHRILIFHKCMLAFVCKFFARKFSKLYLLC